MSLLLTPFEKNRYVTFQDDFEQFSGRFMRRFSHIKLICETEEKTTLTVARFGVKSTAGCKLQVSAQLKVAHNEKREIVTTCYPNTSRLSRLLAL